MLSLLAHHPHHHPIVLENHITNLQVHLSPELVSPLTVACYNRAVVFPQACKIYAWYRAQSRTAGIVGEPFVVKSVSCPFGSRPSSTAGLPLPLACWFIFRCDDPFGLFSVSPKSSKSLQGSPHTLMRIASTIMFQDQSWVLRQGRRMISQINQIIWPARGSGIIFCSSMDLDAMRSQDAIH